MSYLDEIFGLNGKVAIVTGGGRGIGQVIARGFAKAGAEVVILNRSNADETIDLIAKDGGKAYFIATDVTDEQSVDAAFAEILKRSGSIDIVFNNAGICMHQTTLEATIKEFREVIDCNLTGEFIVARAAGKIMIERGIKGSIIN
ncbi:MAG: SDR family NAD(P)-dependent oxidoreductase, partial [Planctomycetes bacterium]|nr:SDR family NAD(P)-dependent oxidoreductase [Planctomycetota bacterium]